MSCVGRYFQYPHSILLSIESIPSILPPFLTIIPSKPHRPPNTSPLLMLRIAPLLLQDPLMFLHSPVHPPPPSSTNHYMPLQSIYASDKYCLSPSSFTIFQILPLTILSPGSPMPLFASGILGGQRAAGDRTQAKPHPHLKVIYMKYDRQ